MLLHHIGVTKKKDQSHDRIPKKRGEDARDDTPDRESNPDQAPISKGLPRDDPAHGDNGAGFEVPHDGTADRAGVVDDDELGEVDEAGEEATLNESRQSAISIGGSGQEEHHTNRMSRYDPASVSRHTVTSSENGMMYSITPTLTGAWFSNSCILEQSKVS
jgi:hypothetical protein